MERGRESIQYKRVLNTRELIITTLGDCVSVEALADRLHRKSLIGDDIRREAHDRGVDASKIRRMIDAVICKINLNSANYDMFIDVLREFGDLGDLIEHIERSETSSL